HPRHELFERLTAAHGLSGLLGEDLRNLRWHVWWGLEAEVVITEIVLIEIVERVDDLCSSAATIRTLAFGDQVTIVRARPVSSRRLRLCLLLLEHVAGLIEGHRHLGEFEKPANELDRFVDQLCVLL